VQNVSASEPPLFEPEWERQWLHKAIALWVVLAVAVSVKTIIEPSLHEVYTIFAAASRHWWADAPLYTFYEGMDTYRYTPTFAIALSPLAMLPDRLGGILWNLLSIAVLVWAIRRFVREVLPGDWPPWREGLLLALVVVGSLRGIWSAQSNALVIALALLAAVAIKGRRWWAASFLLAVPVFIKLWPMALVLLLVACWPRQLIGRFSLVAAAGLLVPFFTRPAGVVCRQYTDYYFWLTGPLSQARCGGYRDAITIFEQARLDVGRESYLLVQLATAALVLAWCLWRRRLDSTGRLLVSILSMWAAWQLLFGPGTERLTYGLIAPMSTWALLVSFAEKRLRLLSAAAWLLLSLFSMGAFERAMEPIVPFAPALLPAGVAVFIAWLVLHETAPASVSLPQGPAAAPVPPPHLSRRKAAGRPGSGQTAASRRAE